MNDEQFILVLFFGVAAFFGVRDSLRVTQRYLDVKTALDWRERLVLMLLVFICWTITIAAAWYGILAVRRALGFEPLGFVAIPISIVISSLILFVPSIIRAVLEFIAREDKVRS